MNSRNLRNFIFGVEDGLVSTAGLLTGIAIAGTAMKTIILAGVVLIFVEAFSMGVGSLMSENSANELTKRGDVSLFKSVVPGTIMFVSYLLSGFIPLFPYFILPVDTALFVSVVVSLIALFILGYVGAMMTGAGRWKHAIEMFIIGGVAITLGTLVGVFVNTL